MKLKITEVGPDNVEQDKYRVVVKYEIIDGEGEVRGASSAVAEAGATDDDILELLEQHLARATERFGRCDAFRDAHPEVGGDE